MQVLVIAVQNAVPHHDLGVATAGATFFRSIGGSFGTAVFGAIFANVLGSRLATALHGVPVPSGLGPSVSPAEIAHLSPTVLHAVVSAYSSTIGTVFLVAVPISAVAFLLTWLLPEIRLRTSTGGHPGPGAPDEPATSPATPQPRRPRTGRAGGSDVSPGSAREPGTRIGAGSATEPPESTDRAKGLLPTGDPTGSP